MLPPHVMSTDAGGSMDYQFLSLEEFIPWADVRTEQDKKLLEMAFNTADTQKDGKLSAAELPRAINEYILLLDGRMDDETKPKDIMNKVNKDKNGFLSLAELMTWAGFETKDKKLYEKAFDVADTNNDGKLSAAELKAYEKLSEDHDL